MDVNLKQSEGVGEREPAFVGFTLWASLLLLLGALEPYLEMEGHLWLSTSKQNSAALIAFVGFLWMLLGRKREIFDAHRVASPWALSFAAFSLVFLWFALLMDIRSGVALFSILLLLSSLHFLFGFRSSPSTFFAGTFLLATVPIPGGLMARMGQALVEAAASISHVLLSPFYSGLELLGYSLVLPSGKAVEIVDDCNGLAGILLFPVLVLVLLAFWRVKKWKLGIFFLSLSFFAAFGGNLLRILLTAIFEFQGVSLNHSPVFHEILGLASLGVFFVPLAFGLYKIQGSGRKGEQA